MSQFAGSLVPPDADDESPFANLGEFESDTPTASVEAVLPEAFAELTTGEARVENESAEFPEVAESYAELDAEAYADSEWSPESENPVEPESELTRDSASDRQRGVVRRGAFVRCSGKSQPGAKALAAQWTRVSGIKAGVYNCRSTVFGTPSLHGEGRAIDCYANVNNPEQRAKADAYIAWLQANAVELQVAVVIWNRRIWAWHRRGQGWRGYKGNPHTDHFHVEMSWEGALKPSRLLAGTSEPGGILAPVVAKARADLGLEPDSIEGPDSDVADSSTELEAETNPVAELDFDEIEGWSSGQLRTEFTDATGETGVDLSENGRTIPKQKGPVPDNSIAAHLLGQWMSIWNLPNNTMGAWPPQWFVRAREKVTRTSDDVPLLPGAQPFWPLQLIEKASSVDANMDLYQARIDQFPLVDGSRLDHRALSERVRLNLNDFVSTRWSSFEPADAEERAIWVRPDARGAIITIDAAGPDNFNVMCIAHYSTESSAGWIFSTMTTGEKGRHALSGNREFGIRQHDGTWRFFTRAIDRWEGWVNAFDGRFLGYGSEAQDRLWRSLVSHVVAFVADNGGSAVALPPTRKAVEWRFLRPYFRR